MPGLASPFSIAMGAPQHFVRLESHTLTPSFHNTIASWLVEERGIPVWVELLQDSREYLDVGQYRHVVIDSRTALEVYIDQTLLLRFRERGTSVAEAIIELGIASRFASQIATLEEAISYARMNDKLKRGLRAALGLQIGRRVIWPNWLTAKRTRELGAHYGASVPEHDARHALETVEEMVRIVHQAGSPASVGIAIQ